MVLSPHLQAVALSLDIAQPSRLVERAVFAAAFPSSLHLISHESIFPPGTVQGVGVAELRGCAAAKQAGSHHHRPCGSDWFSGSPTLSISLTWGFPLNSAFFFSLCIQVLIDYPIISQSSGVKRMSEDAA